MKDSLPDPHRPRPYGTCIKPLYLHDRGDSLRFLIERSIQYNRISFWELALQIPNPNLKWYNFLYEPQIHARLHWEEQWIQ